MGAIILALNGWYPETSCRCGEWQITSRLFWAPAFVFIVTAAYLAPFAIYVLARASVLDALTTQLPKKFKSWIQVGIGIDGKPAKPSAHEQPYLSSASMFVMALRWLTPFCSRRGRLPIAYDGIDSRQGRLTRIAMAELFNSRHAVSSTNAIYSWIFYGLAPLWTFLLLMIVILLAAGISKGCLVQKEDLLLFDIAWILLASTFFVIEMPRMPHDLTVKADDLASLPSQISRPKNRLVTVITNNLFGLMLNAAVTIIAVVYATLAALVR